MVEKGTMQSIKEGGMAGALAGVSVGAVRSFLFGRDIDVKEHADRLKAQRLSSTSATNIAKSTALASSPSSSASVVKPNVFPRLLRTTATYASVGAVFMGTESILRINRDVDDAYNRIIAAAAAGSLIGVRAGSFFVSAGAMAALAAGVAFNHAFHGIGPYDKDYYKKRLQMIYRE